MDKDYIEENMLISRKTVFQMVGLSNSTIWRLEREGKFPKRKQLSKNRVAWLKKEILNWIKQRADAI
ncbi:helix-turn-helix transcriptional regulator [Pelistega ratti]|uniref:helix-turn-helix transcriptional regulator n=1 Tax=Pelistega ratti TaxID=2652177 RepID=UPI001FAA825A|nr:AlpA family phage regulatory protein [Pelistega ratti]